MTTNGTAWVVRYVQGALSRIARVDKRIPLMLQDCFLGEEHWSPYFATRSNLVIDTQRYAWSYYVQGAASGTRSTTAVPWWMGRVLRGTTSLMSD
jgi:hypothetical protein